LPLRKFDWKSACFTFKSKNSSRFYTPEKKHIIFNGSYLRVWRKIKGEWKGEAFFACPNEGGKKAASNNAALEQSAGEPRITPVVRATGKRK